MRAQRRAGPHGAGLAALLLLACLLAPEAARAEPSVAVVPFRVNSARPIEYLGESLANLIRTRLEASGELVVVPAAAVRERTGAGPVDPADVRQLVVDLGADHLVTGALTELAGRFSLDVRVTPSAPAGPVRTLVLTAEREEDLLDRVNELADEILRHVVGAPPAVVAEVVVEGAEELGPALRDRLRTRAGELYDPTTVRDDLAALRADPDVARASAETESGPDGTTVRFQIVPAARLLVEPSERAGKLVAAVQVRGNRRIEADAIKARLGTRAGEPFNATQISKDVRAVHALGFFRDVRVFSEETVAGRVVTFEVEENPVVRQISISGNESVEGEKIRDILTLTLGSALDYPLLFENRARVQALYKAQGYYLAEVGHEIEPLAEGSVGIHFIVDENEKLKLREIEFIGNEHFSDRELREDFQTKIWRFWSYVTRFFDKSGTYSEPLFVQDLRKVEKRYTDAGYIQVQIGEPNVIPEPDGLRVSVAIDEGLRFRVGAIDLAGDETLDVEALRSKLELEEGDWFDRSALTNDVTQLTDHYTDRGFYFASVQPLTNVSENEQTVDVIFEVRKGPLYFVRNIEIAGNTQTVDPVIRREIPIVEGQLYSRREINLARARIEGLGFFEEVDFQMEPTGEEDQLDLAFSVVEKPTGSFSFGAGFSSQDSFIVQGSLSQSNLFGRGYAANASLQWGGRSQRFYLSLEDPYFLGSTFSLGGSIFWSSVNFEDFEQEDIGASLVLGHSLSEDNRSRGSLRYSFVSQKIQEDQNTVAASIILRELFQDQITTSLTGISFITDRRNDRLSPTSGYELGAQLEFAGLGFFSQFLRAEARANWYLGAPGFLPEKSTFVVGTRLGYALPLNSISDFDFPSTAGFLNSGDPVLGDDLLPLSEIDDDLTLPLSERYFLGGLGRFQLRGYEARSVGPRRPLLIRDNQFTGRYYARGQSLVYSTTGTMDELKDPFTEPPAGTGREVWYATCSQNLADPTAPRTDDCNQPDQKDDEIVDLDDSDVIGGNKFISTSFEYRFPISETLGLQGLLFLDMGDAFAEGENLFDVTEWRYGTGAGVQWFSPFGPLAVILGFPLNRLAEVEDPVVFEFSVGGQGF